MMPVPMAGLRNHISHFVARYNAKPSVHYPLASRALYTIIIHAVAAVMEVFSRITSSELDWQREQALEESAGRGERATRDSRSEPVTYDDVLHIVQPTMLRGASNVIITKADDGWPIDDVRIAHDILQPEPEQSMSARIEEVSRNTPVKNDDNQSSVPVMLAGNQIFSTHMGQTVEVTVPNQLIGQDHKGGVFGQGESQRFTAPSQWWFTSGSWTTRAHVDETNVAACMPAFCPAGALKVWAVVPHERLQRANKLWNGREVEGAYTMQTRANAFVAMACTIPEVVVFCQRPGDVVVIPAGFVHAVHTCYDEGIVDQWCALGGPLWLLRNHRDLQAAFSFGEKLSAQDRLREDTAHIYYPRLLAPLYRLWKGESKVAKPIAAYKYLKDTLHSMNGRKAQSEGGRKGRANCRAKRDRMKKARAARTGSMSMDIGLRKRQRC